MIRVKIGVKIAMGFILAFICLTAIGVNSYFATLRLNNQNRVTEQSHERVLTLERLLSSLVNAQTGVRGFVLSGQDTYLVPYLQQRDGVSIQIAALKAMLPHDSVQQQKLAQLQTLFNQELEIWENTISARRAHGLKAALSLIAEGSSKQRMDAMRAQIQAMQQVEQAQVNRGDREVRHLTAFNQQIIFWGTLLTALLVAAVGFLITRDIAIPLQEVAEAANQIARGNVNVHLSTTRRADEVGALARSFSLMSDFLRALADQAERISRGDLTGEIVLHDDNDMLGASFATMSRELQQMTARLKESAAVLASSVQQILASVHDVNSGVTETAASVSQTTATVEEVRQTANLSSQKARAVSEIAQRSLEISAQGKNSVDEAITGMERIRQQMEVIAASIVRMSEHGQAIGEIISVVNDLAEQSNLLAVNAAIEAARAGEQGKGFAIVAQEVRSLANQSRQATAQVRTILNEIQKSTSAAVMAAEQGSRSVEAGMQQASQSGEAMQHLTASIAEAARAAVQIAASSQQQLVGMDQIAEAVESVKLASVQNVSSVQQVQSVAQHLEKTGEELARLVQHYRTAAGASA